MTPARSAACGYDARAVDIFAGPGGWDVAAADVGVRPLGIERDAAACATRTAAGHDTVQGDVAELNPAAFAPCDLLIASPPCPTFSTAGVRAGHAVSDIITGCALALAAGIDERAAAREKAREILEPICLRRERKRARNSNSTADEAGARARAATEAAMSLLVVEPLRWTLSLRPQLVAIEQVPPVMPLWRAFAMLLERHGYWTWAGLLSAEQYGVPQTRERAFLLASTAGPVAPPAPTHQRYEPGVPASEQLTLEGVLAPWVSMAEALGWGATARPYPVIASSRTSGGPDREKVGGSGARAALYAEQGGGTLVVGFPRRADGGRVVTLDGDDYRARDVRDAIEPSFAVTEKARSWHVNTGRDWKPGGGRMDAQSFDACEQPAPTVDGKGRWHAEAREHEPRDRDWPTKRPATTVAGDPRVAQPGHKAETLTPDAPGRMEGAIRVTLEDAAVLQGFRRDYPFTGTRSKQFEQVGNAVPPPLAHAVLASLLSTSPTIAATVPLLEGSRARGFEGKPRLASPQDAPQTMERLAAPR